MKKSTLIKTGLGILGGAAIAGEVIRRTHIRNTLHMERNSDRSITSIIDDISHIEREAELIPYVESVDILEKSEQGARYIVRGTAVKLKWWIEYTKSWDAERGVVEWQSDRGSYGLKNYGSIHIRDTGDHRCIEFDTDFSMGLPVIGALEEEVVRPFLVYAFSTWLDHLAHG